MLVSIERADKAENFKSSSTDHFLRAIHEKLNQYLFVRYAKSRSNENWHQISEISPRSAEKLHPFQKLRIHSFDDTQQLVKVML